MKEIKAFVRRSHIQEVVDALENAGFNCMSVLDVPGLGLLSDPKKFKYSSEFIKYSTVVKIELACKNEDVDRAVEIIKTTARTQHAGDGIILVSPVDRAIKIRTGEEGKHILQA
jgi:nitrogen regulatory protein P-II 1